MDTPSGHPADCLADFNSCRRVVRRSTCRRPTKGFRTGRSSARSSTSPAASRRSTSSGGLRRLHSTISTTPTAAPRVPSSAWASATPFNRGDHEDHRCSGIRSRRLGRASGGRPGRRRRGGPAGAAGDPRAGQAHARRRSSSLRPRKRSSGRSTTSCRWTCRPSIARATWRWRRS